MGGSINVKRARLSGVISSACFILRKYNKQVITLQASSMESLKKIPNRFCKCTLVIPVHAVETYVNPCKSEFGGYFNV